MILISKQQKEEWEAEIAEDETYPHKLDECRDLSDEDHYYTGESSGKLKLLKEFLSKSVVLPVEDSWNTIGEDTGTFYNDDAEVLCSHFPNGVIIKKTII